jgi:hypothetical protein
VDDPDVVVAVDGDTGDGADQPFVRQRLRSEGIDPVRGDKLRRRDDTIVGQRRSIPRQQEQQPAKARNLLLHSVPLASNKS